MALEGTGKVVLSSIITDPYEIRKVPKDFKKCVMMYIPKKKAGNVKNIEQ